MARRPSLKRPLIVKTLIYQLLALLVAFFALLMVLVMVSLYRVLDQEYTRERRQAQRQRHMIDAWIAREMAAQEETQAEAARAQDRD